MEQLQLEQYFQKIGLARPVSASETGLFDAHQGQFYSLPFENLTIQLGENVVTDLDSLFNKLVTNNRGGYCFELNELMRYVLIASGFWVRPLLARVHLGDVPSAKTHQINLVKLGNRLWIMDVGFGAGGPRFPIPLEEGTVIRHATANYRLVKTFAWGWMLQTYFPHESDNPKWQDSYSFDLSNVTQQDLALGNFYTSTSLDVHFTQVRTISLPTQTGRKSINNFNFIQWHDDVKTETTIANDEKYLEVLANEFGIVLHKPYEALHPLTP